MKSIQQDIEILENIDNKLKDSEGLKVTAPLKEQISKKLYDKVISLELPQKIKSSWTELNTRRTEQLERQRLILDQVDEFIDEIYPKAQPWQSSLHLPIALNAVKTLHARMYAASFGQQQLFTVKARREIDQDRTLVIEQLLRYSQTDWSNRFQGIDDVGDKFIMRWITTGRGILKSRWVRDISSYRDVENVMTHYKDEVVRGPDGVLTPIQVPNFEEREITKTEVTYEGIITEVIEDEDLVISNGSVDEADMVIHRQYMTRSELLAGSYRKLFDSDAVDSIIESGNNMIAAGQNAGIKQERALHAGLADAEAEKQRYEILECYLRADVDDSGIDSDIIVWVATNNCAVLRATYLRRQNPAGLRPFHVSDFYKRASSDQPCGLPELIWSVTKEIDAMSNLQIDFGILSSLPVGFYRSGSAVQQTRLPIEPGMMIPLENPMQDIVFPQMGNRTSFTQNEIAFLIGIVERSTALSDLNYGSLGGQGVARTATGASALIREGSSNLDIYLRRLNRGLKHYLKYTFALLQSNLPPNFEFRLVGSLANNTKFLKVKSPLEIAGQFDFELEPNSANSSKELMIQTADQIAQLVMDPIALQTGIITPLEIFEIKKNQLVQRGIREWSRYLRKPSDIKRYLTPEEFYNRLLAGLPIDITPDLDLEGIIAAGQEVLNDDMLLGQFQAEQVQMVNAAVMQATQLQQAIQSMKAQRAQMQQQAMNSSSSPTQNTGDQNGQQPVAPQS